MQLHPYYQSELFRQSKFKIFFTYLDPDWDLGEFLLFISAIRNFDNILKKIHKQCLSNKTYDETVSFCISFIKISYQNGHKSQLLEKCIYLYFYIFLDKTWNNHELLVFEISLREFKIFFSEMQTKYLPHKSLKKIFKFHKNWFNLRHELKKQQNFLYILN